MENMENMVNVNDVHAMLTKMAKEYESEAEKYYEKGDIERKERFENFSRAIHDAMFELAQLYRRQLNAEYLKNKPV